MPISPQIGTLAGTITFDSVSGNATSANIVANFPGYPSYFQFIDSAIPAVTSVPAPDPIGPPPDYSLVHAGFTTVEVVQRGLGSYGLNFTVSDALLTSPSGDPFGGSIQAYNSMTGSYSVTSGLLTPIDAVAPTPEPSSLILLATGAASLVGAVRRRFLNA